MLLLCFVLQLFTQRRIIFNFIESTFVYYDYTPTSSKFKTSEVSFVVQNSANGSEGWTVWMKRQQICFNHYIIVFDINAFFEIAFFI